MSNNEAGVPIALLSQTGEPGRHLREALAAAGTPIVYEAHAAHLDRDALEQSGARVVVVNLDSDVEAHFDDVYALIGDDRYNVIFNEAGVSSQLSGWEQARWARHLAAKILGSNNADPPRPAGAQSPPEPVRIKPQAAPDVIEALIESSRAPAVAAQPPETARGSAGAAEARPETPHTGPVTTAPPIPSDPGPDEFNFADLEELLSPPETRSAPPPAIETPHVADVPIVPAIEVAVPFAAEDDVIDFGDIGRFDDAPAIDVHVNRSDTSTPASDGVDDALGFADLDDFAAGPDFADSAEGLEIADVEMEVAEDFGVTLESAAADISAAVTAATPDAFELLDLDWADAPKDDSGAAVEMSEVVPPPPVIGSALAWTLESLDETLDASPPVPDAQRDFGIETMSAAEFLAPEVESTSQPSPISADSLSLELMPIEEAVTPRPAESVARESWLDPSAISVPKAAVVREVWVLGASIGGPEAVREFLAELPADYPALFLLAQHMGAEFMQLMAQQLSRHVQLTVRTPTHGERVGHGDIVVVPTTHRLRVDGEGVVMLEALGDTSAAHSPNIDDLLHGVADNFGAKAGVIVFSGMADDAAEGSRYLSGKGGRVYVQDPQSCVISSMVDGVVETGVVQFSGTPRSLAEKLLGDRPAAGKT